jgi:hypothetical protein
VDVVVRPLDDAPARFAWERPTSEIARSTGGPLIHCATTLATKPQQSALRLRLSRCIEMARIMHPFEANKQRGDVMGTIESNVDKTMSKLQDQLKLWGAKLTELAAKVEVAGHETKIDARNRLDDMKAKMKVAQAKLDEAKAAGGDKWDKFKSGIEGSWKELERAFQKLTH